MKKVGVVVLIVSLLVVVLLFSSITGNAVIDIGKWFSSFEKKLNLLQMLV